MKRRSVAEKLLIEEMSKIGLLFKNSIRGLSIGEIIKLLRENLGMTQKILAKRAGMPQSTISNVEQNQKAINLATLKKIFDAMSCELVIAPILHESIDDIRRRQAKKIAEKHVRYLKGTMNLEKQQPDERLIEELRKQEEEDLLKGPGKKLWEE